MHIHHASTIQHRLVLYNIIRILDLIKLNYSTSVNEFTGDEGQRYRCKEGRTEGQKEGRRDGRNERTSVLGILRREPKYHQAYIILILLS